LRGFISTTLDLSAQTSAYDLSATATPKILGFNHWTCNQFFFFAWKKINKAISFRMGCAPHSCSLLLEKLAGSNYHPY